MTPLRGLALGAALALPAGRLAAQSRTVVEQERREHAGWVSTAPLSPRRAVGVFPVGRGLSLGPPQADVPLAGVAASQLVEQDGRLLLRTGSNQRPLARGRPLELAGWHLLAGGTPGRMVLTVFAAELRAGKPPAWYAYDPRLVFTVTLVPASSPASLRVLAPDGVEVEATEAGSVRVTLGGRTQSLRVRRLPGAVEEESELEIFFRDLTNGKQTYPAGRFVALIPQGEEKYLLDFNRARNPFCAYNTAYPCPAPWQGNGLLTAVRAGQQYHDAGLAQPPGL